MLGSFNSPQGGTKMVLPSGVFGNGGGAVDLQPKPLPTFAPRTPPPGQPGQASATPVSAEGRVLAAFTINVSRDATGTPVPGATPPPAQPSSTPAVDKPLQLLQKFAADDGFPDQDLSFFRRADSTATAGRSALQTTAGWELIPTLIDSTNKIAIANTNQPGEYALFDKNLVTQTSYTAYVPQIEPGTLNSSVTVRNTGSSSATVTLDFRRADGSRALATSPTYSISAGASQLVYVPSITDLPTGTFSLTITSTQPISVVSSASQAANNASTSYGALAASSVDLVLNFPQVYRDYFGFSSKIVLQNSGSSAATVTISYLNTSGLQVGTESATLPAGGSTTLDQGANTALPTAYAGSAVVTSSSRLAGIANVYGSGGRLLSTIQGVGSGAQQAYLPALYKSYYGFDSSFLVQNVDSSDAEIEITYSSGYKKTTRVPVGASSLQFQPGEDALPAGWTGSAVVRTTNGTRIVAVGNVQSSATGRLSAYNAPVDGAATVIAPANYNGYSSLAFASSLTVQNVDSAATDVEVVFGDGWVEQVRNLAAGRSQLLFLPGLNGLTPGWQGGAVIRSLSNKRLIAVVNIEAQASSLGNDDWLSTYVGFGT